MATTGLELHLDPETLAEVEKEFKEKIKDYTYKSRISPDQKPPVRTKEKHCA
jgi:hypothetical protein